MLDYRCAGHDLEHQAECEVSPSVRELNNTEPPRPSRSRLLLAVALGVSILLAVLGLLLGIPVVVAVFGTFAIALGALRFDLKTQRILQPEDTSR